MDVDRVREVAGIMAGVGGTIGVLGRGVTVLHRTMRRLSTFLDSWEGIPGPGGRPGVMAEIAGLKASMIEVRRALGLPISTVGGGQDDHES